MTRILTATEVKAKILAILDEVAAGEAVEITQHGRVVARVPATDSPAFKGIMAGVAISVADDEELFTTGAARNLE
jgi:prevent-host-death family protein